ncbi:hypothetical protein NDU88_001940 [Pleurodeles waltl]|uniref:Uncharacterized protein n=1 Tax=Pleurodeles waltl TaxID=8319 RepID=A0AAV7TJQ6_PLEWA|nr:hypothetical protein NDU88_001940 [Pleurodeles waltl]
MFMVPISMSKEESYPIVLSLVSRREGDRGCRQRPLHQPSRSDVPHKQAANRRRGRQGRRLRCPPGPCHCGLATGLSAPQQPRLRSVL